ncbi:hypothetical protein [Bacillus sp. NPDC094106]|uniref:hypothetical protein n=1 Tax=Bacillus sp. NPDC094106 TaxID=3363949 RepID=UPI0038003E97
MSKIHINITKGDFIFAEWKDEDWKLFKKKVHELRLNGYRKVDEFHDFLNFYQVYKKGKSKKRVTVTMMCV